MMRLMATDLDGTLLNSQKEISAGNLEAICLAAERGVQLCLATGRTFPGVVSYAREIFEATGVEPYMILGSGATVFRYGGDEPLYRRWLDYGDYRELTGMARAAGIGAPLVSHREDCILTHDPLVSLALMKDSLNGRMPVRYCAEEEITPADRFVKMQFTAAEEEIDDAYGRIPERYFEAYTMTRTAPLCIEIIHRDASKGAALSFLAESLGIGREDVLAIGDHNNDVSMVSYAGMGVAMENGTPEVKAAANRMTADCDRDGFGAAIRALLTESDGGE